jgi:hypothetical protein
MTTDVALTTRPFLLRLALIFALVSYFALLTHAGGPKLIAGTTYFDPSVVGEPLSWPQGQITYYTDQGDLSPILPNAAANSFVASAFGVWTSVPTAALTASSGGQLAEDVGSANVIPNADGSISLPSDIQPSAVSTPVGIVYDADGSVTDALIGSGAGDASQCFSNAVFGTDDNFGTFATYQHALIVINGQCAQGSSQLTDLKYRLIRTIGSVLGLGWSQVNPNVITGQPHATSDDYAGFPVMHPSDPIICTPITKCYPNPAQLAADDVAAISRLYPVTSQNKTNFEGKQVFAASTARIHGSVWFTDRFGNRTQPMQGVNVVARWIDPTTHLPSRVYAISSVSGFPFTGNAGNPITGVKDALGVPFSQWGSVSSSVEGFFDLAGVPLPAGSSAQYQLAVESLDPSWSNHAGPYAPTVVTPSGTMQPVVITLQAGQDVQQDISMSGSAQPLVQWTASENWTSPAKVPISGDWSGSLAGYGDTPYFSLPARAGRTLSVAVTALDESGRASNSKARPVIGMWPDSDQQGTPPPAFTVVPFDTFIFGITRLDAQVASTSNFLIGISDYRGDGRPDYLYHAQVLYADSVSPSRVGVTGGPVGVAGTGFSSRLTATVGKTSASILSVSAGRVLLNAPAQPDGPQSITLTDPATGGSSSMANVLSYGAAPDDTITLLSGLNPATAVGGQAANPVEVMVTASDGQTPVAGATVGWSASNGLQLSVCSGASSCTSITDQSGWAYTWLTPASRGNSTLTATLAPGVYSPQKSVSVSLTSTESVSDIAVAAPDLWIAQGAELNIPLTARVLSNGFPQSNTKVSFRIATGSGNLSAASAQTDSNGYATVTLSVPQFENPIQINACVAPTNAPCQEFYLSPVSVSQLQLQPVAGTAQISTGPAFQPLMVRVVDSSSPPHPVTGATVNFLTTVLRPTRSEEGSDNNSENPTLPVILSVTQSSATSDTKGLAGIVPASAGFSGPLKVDEFVTAGTAAVLDCPLQLLPTAKSGLH